MNLLTYVHKKNWSISGRSFAHGVDWFFTKVFGKKTIKVTWQPSTKRVFVNGGTRYIEPIEDFDDVKNVLFAIDEKRGGDL